MKPGDYVRIINTKAMARDYPNIFNRAWESFFPGENDIGLVDFVTNSLAGIKYGNYDPFLLPKEHLNKVEM